MNRAKALVLIVLLFSPFLIARANCASNTVQIEAETHTGYVYSSGVYTSNYSTIWAATSSLYSFNGSLVLVGQNSYRFLSSTTYTLNGDSTPLQWTPSTPGTHYTLLATNDGDTSYISAGTANYIDCWDFTNVAWTGIAAVRVYLVVRATITPLTIQICLQIGGTVYVSANIAVSSTSYSSKFIEWTKSPATGLDFTDTELNGMQVGVKYISGKVGAFARVTQAYVTVYPSVLAIYRGCLYFDTSSLAGLNITSAKLCMNSTVDTSTQDFNITIQNGQGNDPERPSYPNIQLSDFWQGYYTGNGGSVNSSEITIYEYLNITLTELSWINQTGITKLALRSSRDIAKIMPQVAMYEDYGFYAPMLLEVVYETEVSPAMLFTGLVFLALLVGIPLFLVWDRDRRR